MTIANTFQGQAPPPAGTGGADLAIEQLVGVSAGSMTGRATVGPGVEFEGFIGPWNIDLTDDSVSFISVAGRAKPPFPGFFRVFEPGTFDRYYIAFDKPVEAEEITVCRQFVTAEFSSATQLVVTIGRATTTLAKSSRLHLNKLRAAWCWLVVGGLALLMLGACGVEASQSAGAVAAPISTPPPTAVADEAGPSTKVDEGLFVRTIAPLGDERGLCIDLPGWTPTNINFDAPVISHTCKHGWWNMDGRFDRTALDEGRLEMPYFERCLEAASPTLGSRFFAKACTDEPLQRFTHLETGQIVLASNPELCMSVPDEPHRDAGGDDFWMNGLILDACGEQDTERQRWTFIEPR